MDRMGLVLKNRGPAVQSLAQQAFAIMDTYGASMWLPGNDDAAKNTNDIQSNVNLTSDGIAGYFGDYSTNQLPENFFVNSEMVGASIGTPPTNWINITSSSGIAIAVVGVGSDSEGPYIDYRFNGTSSATNAFPSISILENADKPAATIGEIMAASMDIEVIAGTIGAYSTYLQMQEQNGSYSYLTASYDYLPNDTRKVLQSTKLMVNASVAYAVANFQMAIPLGNSVDVTFRLRKPQMNRGVLKPYCATPVGSGVARSRFIPYYQTTSSQKPTLRGNPVNYCRNNRDMSINAGSSTLTNLGYNTYPIAGKCGVYSETASVGNHALSFGNVTLLANMPNNTVVYTAVKVKVIDPASKGTLVRVQGRTNDGAGYPSATFNMITKTYTSVSGGALGGSISGPDSEGFYTLTVYYNSGVGSFGNICYVNFNGGISEAGDTNFTLEIGCVQRGIGQVPPSIIVDQGSVEIASANQGPFYWDFDGVNDRLRIAKPILNFNGDCFRLAAFKIPPAAGSTWVLAGSYAASNERGLQIYILSATLDVKCSQKDSTGTGPDHGNTRAANENVIVSGRRTAADTKVEIHGDINAPYSVVSAGANANWTSARERIGCYSPNGSDSLFYPAPVYGMIEGNGTLSDADNLVLRNFLAALAGINYIP